MFHRGYVAKVYLNVLDIWLNTANYTTPNFTELKHARDINVEITAEESDAGHRLSLFNYVIGGKVNVNFDTELLINDNDTAMANAFAMLRDNALIGRGCHFALADGSLSVSGTKYFQGVFLPQLTIRHKHNDLMIVELRGRLYPYPIEPSISTST
jgi:hypothetical protein